MASNMRESDCGLSSDQLRQLNRNWNAAACPIRERVDGAYASPNPGPLADGNRKMRGSAAETRPVGW